MRTVLLFVLTISVLISTTAKAEGLLFEKCGPTRAENDEEALIFLASAPWPPSMKSKIPGVSCQTLRSTFEAADIVKLALIPAGIALATPGVKESIAAELGALGLTLTNPAVLGVTVVVGSVAVTTYFVMKVSYEDCKRRDRDLLRDEIVRELERKYGAQYPSNGALLFQK